MSCIVIAAFVSLGCNLFCRGLNHSRVHVGSYPPPYLDFSLQIRRAFSIIMPGKNEDASIAQFIAITGSTWVSLFKSISLIYLTPPWVIRDNNARHFLKKHKRLDAAIDAYFNDSSSASSSSQPKLAGHALSTAEIVKQFNKYKGPDNIYYGKKTIIKMLSFQFQIRMVKTSLWTGRWSFVRTWKSILKTSFYSHWRTNWSPQGWLSGRNKGGLRAGRKCRAYTWSSPAGSWAKISFFNH